MRKLFLFGLIVFINGVTYGVNLDSLKLANDSLRILLKKASSDSVIVLEALAINHKQQAETNFGLSNFDLAIGNYLDALKIYERLGDKAGEAFSYDKLGLFYGKHGDFKKAVESFNRSIRFYEEVGNEKDKASPLNNLGALYERNGDYEIALDKYNSSLEITTKYHDTLGMSYNYDYMAGTYMMMGDYKKAEELLLKALELRLVCCDEWSQGITLNNIGELYFAMEDYENAIKYSRMSLEMSQKVRFKDLIQHTYGMLSASLEKSGEFAKALDAYKLHTLYKDSIFNESKSKEIGKLEAQYEMEKQQEEELRIKNEELKIANEQKSRRNNLQFSGIFVFVLILFVFVFMSGKFSMSQKVAEGLIFFTFLLFFEFCLVLLDPIIEQWSGGEPLYKLLFNAILAGTIFPAHAFFESTLKAKLLKK